MTYSWTQVGGLLIVLDDPTASMPTFDAPYVSADQTLTFQLDYDWAQVSGPTVTLVPNNLVVDPSFTAPYGIGTQLVFDVVVGDGQEWSTLDEVTITVVENSRPVANAGPDQTRGEFTQVVLDGSGSIDPDGDALTYEWIQLSGPLVMLTDPSSPTPSFVAPAVPSGGAAIEFQLVVTDDDPLNQKVSTPDLVTVNIINVNDPPQCDLGRSFCPDTKFQSQQSVEECVMWPPNHSMLAVSVAGIVDPDSEESDVTIRITSVTQDEPVDGLGDGDTGPDASIQSGEMIDSVLLRAERSGLEDGRVYRVDFTADDGLESCTGSVTIGVPHDRKDEPVDSGQNYDSLGGS